MELKKTNKQPTNSFDPESRRLRGERAQRKAKRKIITKMLELKANICPRVTRGDFLAGRGMVRGHGKMKRSCLLFYETHPE